MKKDVFDIETRIERLRNESLHWTDVAKISLFLLLLFNGFEAMNLEPVRSFAITTIFITFYIGLIGFFIILYLKRMDLQRYSLLFIGVGSYLLANILTEMIHIETSLEFSLLKLFMYLCFFLLVCLLTWKDKQIILFGHIVNGALLLYTIHWFVLGTPIDRYLSFFRNPNISGVFFSCLFVIVILAFKYGNMYSKVIFTFGLLGGMLIIYSSTSRAVYLLLFIMISSRIILYLSKKWFHRLFYIVMGFNLVFLFFYSYVANTKFAEKIDAFSTTYLHKSFFSGRQHIWTPSLEYGMDAPFTGHFIGIMPRDYMEGTHYVHAHNQYVQVFLESGFLGLIGLIVMLYIIWRILQKGLESSLVSWVACFFLGLLFYQSVEISLLSYMEPIGLIQWFILGLGVSKVLTYTGEELFVHNRSFKRRRF